MSKVVATPEPVAVGFPSTATGIQPDRSPEVIRPEPLLRPSTLVHHIPGQLQGISDFSQALLDTAILEARNKERWIAALERHVQGKADQDTIDLAEIRFSSVTRSTLATDVQRGRKALAALANRPGMQAAWEKYGIDSQTAHLRIFDGRLEVLDSAGRWIDLSEPVSARPGLKKRFDTLLDMAQTTGHILHSTGEVDALQMLRVTLPNADGQDVPRSAKVIRNLIGWQRHPLPSSPPMGNYTGPWLALDSPLKLSQQDRQTLVGSFERFVGPQWLDKQQPLSGDVDAHILGRLRSQKNLNVYRQHRLLEGLNAPHDGLRKQQLNQLQVTAHLLRIDPHLGQQRNHVAGYDLYSLQNAGLKMADARKDLHMHLVQNKGVSPDAVEVVSHLFLATVAPEFLVRNIPDTVHIGSPAWLVLRKTVALLEALAPGSSRTLTYAQVLERAALQPPTPTLVPLFQAAEADPLLDWGVLNGVIAGRADDRYTVEDLRKSAGKYKDYIQTTQKATAVLQTPPVTRRALAQADLKAVFPGRDLDKPVQRDTYPMPFFMADPSHELSLIDLHMMGALKNGEYAQKVANGPFGGTTAETGGELADLQAGFNRLRFTKDMLDRSVKSGGDTFTSAITTRLKELFSKMPYQDRQLLEREELTFYRVEGESITAEGKAISDAAEQTERVKGRYGFIVQAGQGDNAKCFEFWPLRGEYFERPDFLKALARGEAQVPRVWVTKLQSHADGHGAGESEVQIRALRETLPAGSGRGSLADGGYFSQKTRDFAAYVRRHDLVLNRQELLDSAMGTTPRERFEARTQEAVKTIEDLLIPFKGCYDDIASGRVKTELGALTGCALDAVMIGSVVAGEVVEGAQAVSRAETALSKMSAATRAFGALSNNLFNPVAGLEQPLQAGYEWLSSRPVFRLGRPLGELRATWKTAMKEQLGAPPFATERPRKMRRPSVDGEQPRPHDPAQLPTLETAGTPAATPLLEQSRQAIERALPIARERLNGALSALSDPEFEKDLKFVCKTFFGADSEEVVAAFTRKQRTMKVDLDKLDLSNINFLENEGSEWQAQLLPSSYSRYKAGYRQEKYIEVNVNGATDYYRSMGSSDDAMANTLIHEQAHGFPGDEDYVYSGAIKGGREDIADLLNLGNTTDPKHFRHLGDEVQEATLSLFAKAPQAHNADSTLFGIALLDQAKNNRPLYKENVKAIQQALDKAKATGGVITEQLPVRIIRKRAVSSAPLPRFVLVRHDQTGKIVQVLERLPRPGGHGPHAPRSVSDVVQEVFKWH